MLDDAIQLYFEIKGYIHNITRHYSKTYFAGTKSLTFIQPRPEHSLKKLFVSVYQTP